MRVANFKLDLSNIGCEMKTICIYSVSPAPDIQKEIND